MFGESYKAFPIHQQLGNEFFDAVQPAIFPKAIIRYRNLEWSKRLGMDQFSDKEWVQYFAEFKALPENLKEPLALRYHGHQFQSYNPDLGDGRGFLYAQMLEPGTGRILDFGTKGSGTTPYSRRGDGRLTLKGAMREVLATEWLEALGVNTSKSFSVIETGEALERNDEPSPTRSAVLVRLSHSHIRFGSFQRLAFLNQVAQLIELIRFSCKYYEPDLDLKKTDSELTWDFFERVALKSADLCAQWMIAGFVHGVLNTDNMNITGESFDYGPYRFLPHYDPLFTAAYFDHSSLYAYGRQPETVYWNLQQLAHALSFIEKNSENVLDKVLEKLQDFFPKRINQKMTELFLYRLNLKSTDEKQDQNFLRATFEFLNVSKVSFDGFFFDWNGGRESLDFAMASERKNFYQGSVFEIWMSQMAHYDCQSPKKLAELRAKWISPESLLIDEVEKIWGKIGQDDDWSLFEEKIRSFKTWGNWYCT